jgi:phospholipid transport system substrate-binding protein
MKKHLYQLTIIMLLFISPLAQAYNSYYGQDRAPSRASIQDPAKSIHDALGKINTFSKSTDTANPVLLRSFIENEIIPHFAFDDMAQWITGPYARQMSTQEKIDFEQELKEAFLGSLARHLGSFNPDSNQVQILAARSSGRNEAVVPVQVYRSDDYPARLEFRMRHDGKMWKIIDVKANGTSAVLYYRKHFMNQLRAYRK